MGTVCKKLDDKMKSGELNQNVLLNEAQQMMQNLGGFGGMGGNADMIRQMGAMMGMNAMGGGGGDKKKKNKKRRRH